MQKALKYGIIGICTLFGIASAVLIISKKREEE